MADHLCDDIMTGIYGDDARILSVREYAALLQVNINTAMKCYETLASDGIIYNKRGLGYFVSPNAAVRIKQQRRIEFMQHTLPSLAIEMKMLNISLKDIEEQLKTID